MSETTLSYPITLLADVSACVRFYTLSRTFYYLVEYMKGVGTSFNFLVRYFLLCSCLSHFYTLRSFQIVLLTSSCGAGKREIRRFVGGRV